MSSNSSASPANMALVRGLRTGAAGAVVRAMTGTVVSTAIPLTVLRSIYATLRSSKREKETHVINGDHNESAHEQADGAEPVLKVIRVLVKPPVHAGKTMGSLVDESINWEKSSKKWKNRSTAPKTKFVMKEVPYDEWRKHYAKDRLGKYRGLEEPAEDCLLLADDEIKWRSATSKEEVDSMAQCEQSIHEFGPIRRAATMPEHSSEAFDNERETNRAFGIPTIKGEAISIESDGHAAVQAVEIPDLGLSSRVFSIDVSSPSSIDVAVDPAISTSKESSSVRFARPRRSSSKDLIH